MDIFQNKKKCLFLIPQGIYIPNFKSIGAGSNELGRVEQQQQEEEEEEEEGGDETLRQLCKHP